MKINWEKEGIIGFYLYFCHVIQNSNYFCVTLQAKFLLEKDYYIGHWISSLLSCQPFHHWHKFLMDITTRSKVRKEQN